MDLGIKKEITIWASENQKSSIRIQHKTWFYEDYLFLHLPPLHKCKDRLKIDLTPNTTHTIYYDPAGTEHLITMIDGYDMRALWAFLETKQIIANMLYDLKNYKRPDRNNFIILQTKFADYNTDIPVTFGELHQFLLIPDQETYEVRCGVAIDYLQRMNDWFYEKSCSNKKCLAISKLGCTGCATPICSEKCMKEHHCK